MVEEIQKLIDKLNYYTKLYDEGKPEISDQQWDEMYFALQKLENENHIYLKDSPTQNISYQVVNQLNKVEHNHPILSLDKTKELKEIDNFMNGEDCIAMAKMDGLTCSLHYLDGKLISAETRGNGLIGEDILHNILQVKNVPKKISYKEDLVIDGEIICTYNDFKPFENEYKNPRNFASGSIRLLDSQESAVRNLTFVAWDIIAEDNTFVDLTSELQFLQNLGFTIVPYTLATSMEVNWVIDFIKTQSQKAGYPIDGVVFKYNLNRVYTAAGKTDHHFKGGIAYKFYDEEYETHLIDIEWTMGRTGVLTPVAIFEPIDIEGTEVSRASLHNVSIMLETLGQPYKGELIKVFRANMIIPQISWGDKKALAVSEFQCQSCPVCGGATRLTDNNGVVTLVCDNPQCQGKLINQLDHFCGKKGLDIKGLSKATLEKLINWGWVSNFVDIYKLENISNEWKNKPGFGEKSVERILNAIEDSKTPSLDAVIAAAGIPLIGRTVAKELCKYIKSYQEFREKVHSGFDFTIYDGFGEVMAAALLDFDYTNIDAVVDYALNIKTIEEPKETTNSLENLIFCITGKVYTVKNRDELKSLIESKGGKVVGSMSSKVNYLINNDNTSTSSKNIAAKNAGIPIITEQELLQMM